MLLSALKGKPIYKSLMLCMLSSLVACGGGSSGGSPSTAINTPSSVSITSSSSSSDSNAQQSSSSSSKSSLAVSVLMGGSIQGKPLNLSSIVSTFAGATPWADGAGLLARFSFPSGVTSDGTNIYITDANNSIIRKIVIATGAVSTVAGKGGQRGNIDGIGASARFDFPTGITTDGVNLYVVDSDVIRKVVIQTGAVTTLAGQYGIKGGADGIGASASFKLSPSSAFEYNYSGDITTDGTYLFVADSGNHAIRKIEIATSKVSTLAGTIGISGSTDGLGATAQFNLPSGIATDKTNLYVSDTYNHTIRKIVLATNEVTTLAGTAGIGGNHGKGTLVGAAARFYYPQGLSTDGINLYVTNSNSTISKVVIASRMVNILAGAESSNGATDGAVTTARFYNPRGITVDGTDLFVTDSTNNTIRKIETTSNIVTTFAGRNIFTVTNQNGIGLTANFDYLNGIATDGKNLYLTDRGSHTILKTIIATGEVSRIAGDKLSYGSTDGIGAAASFKMPAAITTDGTYLYVADSINNTIRQIEINTNTVTTLAGTTSATGVGDFVDGVGSSASFGILKGITTDGTNIYAVDSYKLRKIIIATGATSTIEVKYDSSEAQLKWPEGITTDGTNLYIADMGNSTIRKVVIKSGAITTLAGSTGEQGNVDGTSRDARFKLPTGITCDGTNLYVSDTGNHNIRKVEIATGLVTTLAGSTTSGSEDGIGTKAAFNEPQNIVTDGFNLYVTDTRNQTIRKMQ